jgi:hypothetical protein
MYWHGNMTRNMMQEAPSLGRWLDYLVGEFMDRTGMVRIDSEVIGRG